MASPITIQPSTKDNTINVSQPNVNAGSSANITVQGNTAGLNFCLMDFDLSTIPSGATIISAVLGLYIWNTGGAFTVKASRLLRTDWVEAQSTWNIYKTGSNWGTAGALNTTTDITTTDSVSITTPAAAGWASWTVTNQVQTGVGLTGKVACFHLSSTDAQYFLARSRDYTGGNSNRPKLYIEYSAPPAAPTSAHTDSKTDTEIVMHWTDNSSDETGFKIYKDDTYLETIAAGSVSYTFTGLTAGTQYDLAVKATNASGDSAEAQLTETTLVLAEGGSDSTVIISVQGLGVSIKSGGSSATVVVSGQGSGISIRQGSASATIIVAGQGNGYKIASGGDEALITVASDGVGVKTSQGSSGSSVIVSVDGSGVKIASLGSDSTVIVSAQGSGIKVMSGGSEAIVVVSAGGSGRKIAQGESEQSIIITPQGSGYGSLKTGSSSAIIAISPQGSGQKLTTGAGESIIIIGVEGLGRLYKPIIINVIFSYSALAPAVFNYQASGIATFNPAVTIGGVYGNS